VETTALRVNEMAIAFEIAVRRESYYGFFLHRPPAGLSQARSRQTTDAAQHREGDERGLHRVRLPAGRPRVQAETLHRQPRIDGRLHLPGSLDGRLNHWLSRLVRRLRVD
jgi:hypothetical protein